MSGPPDGGGVARFLRPGPDQRRLLQAMAYGHARAKHGAELGHPTPAAYQHRVAAHLAQAPSITAVTGHDNRIRYLLADITTNHVAWIVPHKEHRSTFFRPRMGAGIYVRAQRVAPSTRAWQTVRRPPVRTRAITSAARAPVRSHGR